MDWMTPHTIGKFWPALAVLGIAAACDAQHVLRLALIMRPKYGLLKALMFAAVVRYNFMPAHHSAADLLVDAKVGNDAYVFDGGSTGILFLPGGLVDPVAYAPLLRDIAHATGATVVCVQMPMRHPMLFDLEHAFRTMRSYPHVRTWIIGGHSLGAAKAAAIAANLLEGTAWSAAGEPSPPTLPDLGGAKVAGLLMLAGMVTGGHDLSKLHDLKCLVILASEDTIVPPDGNAADTGGPVREGIELLCPLQTHLEIIDGGNHAGFGHYGPQTFPLADGQRRVSLDRQQRATAQLSAAFVNSVRGPR